MMTQKAGNFVLIFLLSLVAFYGASIAQIVPSDNGTFRIAFDTDEIKIFLPLVRQSSDSAEDIEDEENGTEETPEDSAGCDGLADEDYTVAAFEVDGDRAVMVGEIDCTTPDVVQALLDEHPEVQTIVMQNVEGSLDDEANLIASRLIRQHGIHTHVPADGLIASGGVDFFLAGAERTVEDGAKLGVHSWAGDGTTGADIPRDDPQHDLYLDYYAEMEIPEDFYWFTLEAAPAEDIHYMSAAEIARYNITTG